MRRTLIIDNYDSFTFNLYQLIGEVTGHEPIVIRNDELCWDDITELELGSVVLSPGPGRPERGEDFGVCAHVIRRADMPILGVCLGHQGIGHVFGGTVRHACEPMHGRLSKVLHDGDGLFAGIPSPFEVVRYHSLVLAEPLPAELLATARTEDGVLMALEHRSRPIYGVQFHPESISTQFGHQLLANFERVVNGWWASRPERRGRKHAPTVVPHARAIPRRGAVRVVHRKLDSLPDAESLFVALYSHKPATFWLDSSLVQDGRARFSYMGAADGPRSRVLRYDVRTRLLSVEEAGRHTILEESIYAYLERELAALSTPSHDLPFGFNCGFVGYLGYELKAECSGEDAHRSPYPDASLIFADRLIVLDHEEQTSWLVALIGADEPDDDARAWFHQQEVAIAQLAPACPVQDPCVRAGSLSIELKRDEATYLRDIQHCLREIRNGETYEVCLTNRMIADVQVDALSLHRILRRMNPAPYAALLRLGDLSVVCSSPERFLRIDSERRATSKPIKGTRRRGKNPREDAALCEQLRTSEKDRAENLMIVDLVRNDLGVVCELGSVSVPNLMHVESYATVHQLVSTVQGRLRDDVSVVDCVRAMFPGGSMTGAPKVRTMKIIDLLEREARGVYSGSIGFFAVGGAVDLNIVIRTIVVTPERLSYGIGGAIVALSDPGAEFEEILLKGLALSRAIRQAVGADDSTVQASGARLAVKTR
jgi:para-aminobenzoate synthetase